VISEFVEKRFMLEKLDILGIVEGGGWSRTLLDLLLISWFSWVDSLEDT
jgi:hypothetical protein